MKTTDFLTEAAADASKADKEGDFKRGDKRFSGIVKATKKQFANDTKQGVAEGSEQINELRDRMYQYIRSIVPTWPEYVVQDWLYKGRGKNKNYNVNSDVKGEIIEMIADAGLSPNTNPWQLVPNMKFTMDMFEPKSKRKLIGRAGGTSDMGMGIPKDAERHATQAALIQKGGVSKEPAILIKRPEGYDLLEGWHRTIQHFHMYPNGYTGTAYVAVAQGQQGVAENNTAKDVNKFFNNVYDPVFPNLQRVALLAMQGRQQEASGQLHSVIKDASPEVQKQIINAVNNIKPVTINGKIADSSTIDKSKQHQDWIINTFIPWVQSQLGKQGVAEGSLKEFAPGPGGGESGRWYTDDQLTDIVGDGWYTDLDVSGDIPKQQMIQQAQAWLDDQGYSVQVLNCKVNDDDMEWYIEGNFQNSRFAKKGVGEASLATMRDYFAGDKNAQDPTTLAKQRQWFDASKDTNGRVVSKKFRNRWEYEQWLKQLKLTQVAAGKEYNEEEEAANLLEYLRKIHKRWAIVSKRGGRPLVYFKGDGRPSKEWIEKQERRINHLKHKK